MTTVLASAWANHVKVRQYGVEYADNSLDQTAWNRIYDETDKQIARYLDTGQSVIDASRNFRRRERNHARAIAASSGAHVLVVYVDTPESVARQRLLANADGLLGDGQLPLLRYLSARVADPAEAADLAQESSSAPIAR